MNVEHPNTTWCIPVSKLNRSLNHLNSASSCSAVSVSSIGPKPPKNRILVPMATHVNLSRGDGGTPLHSIFFHCFVSEQEMNNVRSYKYITPGVGIVWLVRHPLLHMAETHSKKKK